MFGRKRFEKALVSLRALIHEHEDALGAARKKLYAPNRYGIRDPKKWAMELEYFKKNIIDPRLSTFDKALIEGAWGKKNYLNELDAFICHHIENSPKSYTP